MSNNADNSVLSGLAVSGGLAAGPAFIYRGAGAYPVAEYKVAPGAEDAEVLRFRRAVASTRRDIENLMNSLRTRASSGDTKVFECHLMIIEDEFFLGEVESLVLKESINAESALRRTMDSARSKFERMNDPYFRERVRDLDDIERRLQAKLAGCAKGVAFELKKPSIVIADDLTPSETVQLPQNLVLGFATNGGSTTSHVALLARALGIPAVAALGDVTQRVSAGDMVLLDGSSGRVELSPSRERIAEFRAIARLRSESSLAAATAHSPGELADGSRIEMLVNAHHGLPTEAIVSSRASGIGLYRSEYLWIGREVEPSEDEQFEAYRDAALLAGRLGPGAFVTIRTLDIGGDKTMSGGVVREPNPFLGNRSIRYLLSHRETMLAQLRAILRASAFGRVKILHPMISCVEELKECAAALEEAKASLVRKGVPFDGSVQTGAMIEVPAAALNAGNLAEFCDFFSIGTNDLIQYTMAADRGNDAVSRLYQPLNPAVLKLVSATVEAAKKKGLPVAVCGESASNPVEGVYWAALGVDALSMSPAYIPQVAAALSRLSRRDLDEYALVPESLPAGATAAEAEQACRKWLSARVPGISEQSS